MHSIDTSSASDMAQVAYDFGPFLFAILFITTITIFAQQAYVRETDPSRASALRIYFFGSFVFGLILVTTCVSWWIYDRISSKSYVYAVRIAGYDKDTVALSSSDAYSQEVTFPDRQSQANFVFVRSRPIPKGTSVEIDTYPPSGLGSGPEITRLAAPINGFDNRFIYSPPGKLTPN